MEEKGGREGLPARIHGKRSARRGKPVILKPDVHDELLNIIGRVKPPNYRHQETIVCPHYLRK
jgi:hypothetical protein